MKTSFDRHGYCDEPAIVKVLQGGDTLPVLVLVNGCDEKIATIAASAPELLEALEALLESAKSSNASLNWATGLNDEPASFDQARAAIRKARGE